MIFPSLKIDRSRIYIAVAEEFKCAHSNTELRQKISRSGAITIRAQCLACGDYVGKPRKKVEFSAEQLVAMAAHDPTLEQAFWKKRAVRQEDLLKAEAEKVKAEWERVYSIYRDSHEWRGLRERVFKRASHRCEGCMESRATEVHHLHYRRIGCEMLFDLVAVCHACHTRCHPNHTRIFPAELESEVF